MKYIDAEKLIAEIDRQEIGYNADGKHTAEYNTCRKILDIITSLQQEQPKENKLPNKRTRVNYAICKSQVFKPLREAIILDDYVYDEDKCYRENLLNYINAIQENRLTEIRNYLKEKGWWPYDDDADWMKQEQSEVDLEKEMDKFYGMYRDKTGKTYAVEDDEPCFDWKEDELSEKRYANCPSLLRTWIKSNKHMTEIFYSVEVNILYPDKSMLTWGPFHYHDRSLAVERMDDILNDITDWCNLKDPSLHIEPIDLIRIRSNDQIVFRIKAWKDERTLQDCNGIIQVNTQSFED